MKGIIFAISVSFVLAAQTPFCRSTAEGYRCQRGDLQILLVPSEEKWPRFIDEGTIRNLRLGGEEIPCYVDPQKAMECIFQIRGSRYHLYTQKGATVDANLIKQLIEELPHAAETRRDGMEKLREISQSRTSGFGVISSGAGVLPPPSASSVASPPTRDLPQTPPTDNTIRPQHGTPTSHLSPDRTGGILPIRLDGSLRADIDGDGRPERVGWKRIGETELGTFYQLVVLDSDGRILWRGPATIDSDNPYVFGEWDFGISMPAALLDIDGDRQAELLAPAPQSDVSPTFWRILGWNGRRFVARRPAALIQDPQNPKHFIWVNPLPDPEHSTWVMELIPRRSIHEAEAEIYRTGLRGETATGRALLRFSPTGADLLRWIRPLPTFESETSYIARIGRKDHYNSRGRRLRSIGEILHQDRANYYKGRGDPEDTGIGRFGTLAERSRIDRMRIIPRNTTLRELRRAILRGTPLLRITPKPEGMEIEILRPYSSTGQTNFCHDKGIIGNTRSLS